MLLSPPDGGAGTAWAEPKAASSRLAFLDAARGLAILQMLQSHFVGTCLAHAQRTPDNLLFAAHRYLRSFTAPLFLTVSGLVFVYFLQGDTGATTGGRRGRLARGLRRGLTLLLLGYLMHVDLRELLQGYGVDMRWLLAVHVLHVVGVGLWSIALLQFLTGGRLALLGPLLVALGLSVFAAAGLLRGATFASWPAALSAYVTKAHGSVFILQPYVGYMLLGGALGAVITATRRAPSALRTWLHVGLGVALVSGGLALHGNATRWVYAGVRALAAEPSVSAAAAAMHISLTRFGWVAALLGGLLTLDVWIERYAPRMLLTMGRHTLLVYCLHAMILYAALTGVGIGPWLKHRLDTQTTLLGAVLFVGIHVWAVHSTRVLQLSSALARAWDRGLGALTATARRKPGA